MSTDLGGVTAERAPYGRRARRAAAERPRPYDGETYYGRPALKTPYYRWLVSGYLFVGGLAGAAQVIASMATLFGGDRSVVRAGRYIAFLGAIASPVLLIADLHTKARWYNMLRIFRRTSAMSIGSWTLAAFGALSGLLATAQAADDLTGTRALRPAAKALAIPAAGAGAVMSCYTGSLLSSSSIPIWAAVSRRLPTLFALSAAATALSAISLVSIGRGPRRRVELLALGVAVAELAAERAAERDWSASGTDAPLKEGLAGSLYEVGAVRIGTALPIALRAASMIPGAPRALARLAAVATLAGGFAQRSAIVLAGRESSKRPVDAFRFMQEER